MILALKKKNTSVTDSASEANDLDGHSQNRGRKVSHSALAGMAGKAVSIVLNLFLVPLLLNYLGMELFGAWAVISSLNLFLTFADLGIGNSLISSVATAYGKNDNAHIRTLVSNGYAALLGIAALLLCCVLVLAWLNVHIMPVRVTGPHADVLIQQAVYIFMALFIVNMPLVVVQKVQSGLQEGFANGIQQIASSVLSFVFILAAIKLKFDLPVIIFGYMLAPFVTNAAYTIYFFSKHSTKYTPGLSYLDYKLIGSTLKLGSNFLVMQVIFALVYNFDALLIANLLGADQVPLYSVPERLLSLPSLALSMIFIPLWPAYTEAIMRSDYKWVRKTLKWSLLAAIGLSTASVAVLIAAAPLIFKLWVHAKVAPPLALLLGLGVWKVLEASAYATSAFMNGAKLFKFQLISTILFALVVVPFKVYAYKNFGVKIGVWTLPICYMVLQAIPIALKIIITVRSYNFKSIETQLT